MNKKIKGYEVMKLIAEKKIKEGQKLIYTSDDIEIYWDGSSFKYVNSENYLLETIGDIDFATGDFEILEDEEEIDIQGIDIIRDYRTSDDDLYNDNFGDFKSTINDLVKAVKQLDKKINKED